MGGSTSLAPPALTISAWATPPRPTFHGAWNSAESVSDGTCTNAPPSPPPSPPAKPEASQKHSFATAVGMRFMSYPRVGSGRKPNAYAVTDKGVGTSGPSRAGGKADATSQDIVKRPQLSAVELLSAKLEDYPPLQFEKATCCDAVDNTLRVHHSALAFLISLLFPQLWRESRLTQSHAVHIFSCSLLFQLLGNILLVRINPKERLGAEFAPAIHLGLIVAGGSLACSTLLRVWFMQPAYPTLLRGLKINHSLLSWIVGMLVFAAAAICSAVLGYDLECGDHITQKFDFGLYGFTFEADRCSFDLFSGWLISAGWMHLAMEPTALVVIASAAWWTLACLSRLGRPQFLPARRK